MRGARRCRSCDVHPSSRAPRLGLMRIRMRANWSYAYPDAGIQEKAAWGVDVPDRATGERLLHGAALRGHGDLVAWLLERGAAATAVDSDVTRCTALHYAARGGHAVRARAAAATLRLTRVCARRRRALSRSSSPRARGLTRRTPRATRRCTGWRGGGTPRRCASCCRRCPPRRGRASGVRTPPRSLRCSLRCPRRGRR